MAASSTSRCGKTADACCVTSSPSSLSARQNYRKERKKAQQRTTRSGKKKPPHRTPRRAPAPTCPKSYRAPSGKRRWPNNARDKCCWAPAGLLLLNANCSIAADVRCGGASPCSLRRTDTRGCARAWLCKSGRGDDCERSCGCQPQDAEAGEGAMLCAFFCTPCALVGA